jgi:hypothetical protein
MGTANRTRKVRKCPIIMKANKTVTHGKTTSEFTVNYYDSKPKKQGDKFITYTFDNCKKIYEFMDDTKGYTWDKPRVVRKLGNKNVIIDLLYPRYFWGDFFDVDKSISGSIIFKNNDKDNTLTYVGHQIFTFSLLEKSIDFSNVEYIVYLTPSGTVKPYIIGKKYIYSLRDKVAATRESLHLDLTKYITAQQIDLKFKNVKKIPFPFTIIDSGNE